MLTQQQVDTIARAVRDKAETSIANRVEARGGVSSDRVEVAKALLKMLRQEVKS